MKKLILMMVFLGLFLVGCDNSEVSKEKSTDLKVEKGILELTLQEKTVYKEFKGDLDIAELIGLEPMSVAKMYVVAKLQSEYDVEYALYTDRKEHIKWSKEEDEKIPKKDRGTFEQLNETYKNLDDGKFIKTEEDRGYIEFKSSDGKEKQGFQMIKNEDLVWQVAFMPLQ